MKIYNLRKSLFMIVFGLLLIALVFTIAMTSVAQAEEKVFTIPASGGLDNLDPRVLLSTGHAVVQYGIFESLVRTHDGDLLPGMAETWEISDDGLTYTFHLRDAKWSDGKPVTAGDFVHAFVRMFEICPASSIFDDIKNGAQLRAGELPPEQLGVQAPDDKTVVITLKNPVPYFMGLIGMHLGSPGREDLANKFGDGYGATAESLASGATAESLASCGPFILKEWKHEDKLVLEKNPDYWNADKI